ncbi:tRNA lysidine(34) synthetase TilS [Erythrobacter sp. SD-21]|uniref:tRNA lysidine(34) synthetase TilS n=1 Tax=Erythrobacter sp. SD-21 TaxID=161528 RepID=UPI000153F5EF|nr:tRNA lysidine(34) synthetase TilS [Erythrobacter sp. SD-21]EDL47887.1 ATPase [Erythrobacter sp. SD-21]
MALAPELVERFRQDLARVWTLDEGEKMGIAFSGGPDSLALLLLAVEALPGSVEAATVDHGLRAESAEEARNAARICEALGMPHETLSVTIPHGNVQAEARHARYEALAEWAERRSLDYIATAHHADDQAETFLMRANRSSGLSGLAAVRAATSLGEGDLIVLRPLLPWRRSALEDIARDSGFPVAADPSNLDESFDRVRMRKGLAEVDFIDVEGLAGSARYLAEMQDDIDGMALEEWVRAKDEDGAPHRYRPFARSGVDRPVFLAEVVKLFCEDLGATLTRSEARRMVDELLDERPVNIGGIQARRVVGDDVVWTFAPENPRRTG